MTARVDGPPTSAAVAAPQAFVLPTPLATLSADLMPDEIRLRRRLARLKRGLAVVLATLLTLIALGYTVARHQTGGAQDALASANGNIASLDSAIGRFNPVLSTQTETDAIRTQLAGVMGNDVSWTGLVDELAAAAPHGLDVTTLSAQLADPSNAAGSGSDIIGSLTTSAQPTVGTLTLTGIAPDWQAVAVYVRNLSAVKGFTGVNPATLSTSAGAKTRGLQFTIDLNLTSEVLSQSYTVTGATGATVATTGATVATTGSKTPTGSSTTTGSKTAPGSRFGSARTGTSVRNSQENS